MLQNFFSFSTILQEKEKTNKNTIIMLIIILLSIISKLILCIMTSNFFLRLIKILCRPYNFCILITFSVTHSIWCLVVWILIQCSSSKTTSKYLYKIKSEPGTNLSQCLTIINNLIIVNNSNQTGGIINMCVLNKCHYAVKCNSS